ncbi:MAG TPA: hypothetical protein VMK12_22370, partial [Anaeromyxobacteraceae bacterium]|nr:hypothetical protein [Anaeromyxobacteraceae bacterium]
MSKWTTLKAMSSLAVFAIGAPALASDAHAEKQGAATPACCVCCNSSSTAVAAPGGGNGESSDDRAIRRTLREQHAQFLHDAWS